MCLCVHVCVYVCCVCMLFLYKIQGINFFPSQTPGSITTFSVLIRRLCLNCWFPTHKSLHRAAFGSCWYIWHSLRLSKNIHCLKDDIYKKGVLNQIGNYMKSDLLFLKISWNPCKLHFISKNTLVMLSVKLILTYLSCLEFWERAFLSDLNLLYWAQYHRLDSVPVFMLSI